MRNAYFTVPDHFTCHLFCFLRMLLPASSSHTQIYTTCLFKRATPTTCMHCTFSGQHQASSRHAVGNWPSETRSSLRNRLCGARQVDDLGLGPFMYTIYVIHPSQTHFTRASSSGSLITRERRRGNERQASISGSLDNGRASLLVATHMYRH